jgi:hypothetical protein
MLESTEFQQRWALSVSLLYPPKYWVWLGVKQPPARATPGELSAIALPIPMTITEIVARRANPGTDALSL